MSDRSLTSIGDSLSDRDKLLIGLLGAFALIVLAWFIFDDMSMQAELLREQRDNLKAGISEVRAGAPSFLERKQRLEAYEQRLVKNNVSLDKLMERLAKAQGFSIEDFKEQRRVLDEGERRGRRGKRKARDVLVAYTQNVTIRKVNLKQLAAFLQDLERQSAPIRVTSLEVRPSTTDRQELRLVKLSVSTYKREKDS
jgi:predicted  nucleic acid-binding Zn-ribbon protein